jgi:hypothetical protein
VNPVLLAGLLLVADAGGAAPAGGHPIGITGVPDSGVSGVVTRQSTSGKEVVLAVGGGEVRVARWPDPKVPPALERTWLVASSRVHPEGPSTRLELGPEKGDALWVLGTNTRTGNALVPGATLGRAEARKGAAPRVPVLQGEKEVARLRPGETTVLRDDKGRWCLGIASIRMPPPPSPGIASEFNAPRVDFYARRLQGKAKSCGPPAGG